MYNEDRESLSNKRKEISEVWVNEFMKVFMMIAVMNFGIL